MLGNHILDFIRSLDAYVIMNSSNLSYSKSYNFGLNFEFQLTNDDNKDDKISISFFDNMKMIIISVTNNYGDEEEEFTSFVEYVFNVNTDNSVEFEGYYDEFYN